MDHIVPQPLSTPPALKQVDYFAAILKLGISAIPDWGGPAAELFGMITAPLLGKTRDEWFQELHSAFIELSRKVDGLTIESLARNEQFVSVLIQATQTVVKTHQREKREALKNAVINVALGSQPDPNRQQQFLALLDRFSETHLVVLKFLNDPQGHFERHGRSAPYVTRGVSKLLVNNLIADAMPSLRQLSSPDERESTPFQFIELILRDLIANRLVTLEPLNDTWAVPAFSNRQGGEQVQKMATHLGEDFLAFTTAPDFGKEDS